MTWLEGFRFHLYGLLVGIAVVIGGWLASIQAKKYDLNMLQHEHALTWVLVGGFMGGRLWHVGTDFYLYATQLHKIFYIWNGGMSIIGALVGGVISLYVFTRFFSEKSMSSVSAQNFFLTFTDTAIFGLPVAQAIGRLGNYVNYELYGSPTQLPWGIFIPKEYRMPPFEQAQYFHPLFLYEMIATGSFAAGIWWFESANSSKRAANEAKKTKQKNSMQIGTGWLTLLYIFYYAVIRFCLDFLRVDRSAVLYGLGLNQIVLLLTIIVLSGVLWRRARKKYAT